MINTSELNILKQELQAIYQEVKRKEIAKEIQEIGTKLPNKLREAAKQGFNQFEYEVINTETAEWMKDTFSMFSPSIKSKGTFYSVTLRF